MKCTIYEQEEIEKNRSTSTNPVLYKQVIMLEGTQEELKFFMRNLKLSMKCKE
jgi:hypothetical protein